MKDNRTYQIHAGVNVDHGDAALRVTISHYDEQGDLVATKTWRRHVTPLWLEGSEWMAYSAICDLAKMMAHHCGTTVNLEDVDEPLF